jgi:hypothetical protein
MRYIQELETLILERLLPIYYKYHEEHGTLPEKINENLLKQIKQKQSLPRLLQPKKAWK